jgi:hypothetical protein
LKSNDKQFELFDQKVRGLAIRVSSKGTKTFNFHYRMGGRSRRLTLGRYPSTSLKEARQKAQDASRHQLDEHFRLLETATGLATEWQEKL